MRSQTIRLPPSRRAGGVERLAGAHRERFVIQELKQYEPVLSGFDDIRVGVVIGAPRLFSAED